MYHSSEAVLPTTDPLGYLGIVLLGILGAIIKILLPSSNSEVSCQFCMNHAVKQVPGLSASSLSLLVMMQLQI